MTTARARAREELTREIKDAARTQLATVGSAGLSLRAVARELGMVSSAVYRYFPSRDELLTALIVDGYQAVGDAAAEAEAAVKRTDVLGRWLAVTRAVRTWALERPQEYALLFGSPVPGYVAPHDTVDPASRVPLLLLSVVADGHPVAARVPPSIRRDLRGLRKQLPLDLDEAVLARGVMAYTAVIGAISFELFGHLVGSVSDYPSWFDFQMREAAAAIGLT